MRLAGIVCLVLTACGPAQSTGDDDDDGGGSGSGSGSGTGSGSDASCAELIATVRDFTSSHPDFEKRIVDDRGLVRADLGADGKPVFAHSGSTPTVSGAASFDQWYRDVAGVNMTFSIPLPLTQGPSGTFTFDNNAFFPLDGKGFPETLHGHNFHFTTEVHATFKYTGGEIFTFTGDDDVWVFVNKKLGIDLGGVHGIESSTIDFDARAGELGISVGNTYQLDVFHAERHTSASNFRMSTTIECFIIL